MSLEQLMALAQRIAQTPTPAPAGPAAQTQRSCRAQLTADELAALREVWSTPLEPRAAEPVPALLH